MDFDDLLVQYRHHSSFEFRMGDSIRDIARASVPNKPGIYLICGCRTATEAQLLYVGKGGTFKNGHPGQFSEQKLRGRLAEGRHRIEGERVTCQEFLERIMNGGGCEYLEIHWFVTYDDEKNVLPGKAEADVLQVHFEEKTQLPEYNLEF